MLELLADLKKRRTKWPIDYFKCAVSYVLVLQLRNGKSDTKAEEIWVESFTEVFT